MKTLLSIVLLCLAVNISSSQSNTSEKKGVIKACNNYIEGFYEGDTNKLKASLQPTLNKFGFWKNKDTNAYEQQPHMS